MGGRRGGDFCKRLRGCDRSGIWNPLERKLIPERNGAPRHNGGQLRRHRRTALSEVATALDLELSGAQASP
eukprot:7714554-Alexandrium_andersonii.AAC.1